MGKSLIRIITINFLIFLSYYLLLLNNLYGQTRLAIIPHNIYLAFFILIHLAFLIFLILFYFISKKNELAKIYLLTLILILLIGTSFCSWIPPFILDTMPYPN